MTDRPSLQTRLAEALMGALAPCDLGDGNIEVVHDVEALEIEMECALEEDDDGTQQFVRFSAPYERIEIQIDAKSFIRATIDEARYFSASKRSIELSSST